MRCSVHASPMNTFDWVSGRSNHPRDWDGLLIGSDKRDGECRYHQSNREHAVRPFTGHFAVSETSVCAEYYADIGVSFGLKQIAVLYSFRTYGTRRRSRKEFNDADNNVIQSVYSLIMLVCACVYAQFMAPMNSRLYITKGAIEYEEEEKTC